VYLEKPKSLLDCTFCNAAAVVVAEAEAVNYVCVVEKKFSELLSM
jgi:hypothetical protein